MSSDGRTTGLSARGSDGRNPSRPLATRLVFLGTLVTLLVVAASFTLLSLEIRRQSRAHVRELLAQNQKTVLGLQKRGESELLWISRLMAESPTLRAAMETYQGEAGDRAGQRSDLVATVQAELDRTRGLLGRDLAVVTDAAGGVLAVSPPGALPEAETARFGLRPWVERVLRPGFPSETSSAAVLPAGSGRYRIGCVPITLQDFVIGTLCLGERLDAGFLESLRRSLQSDVLLVDSGRVVQSTLPSLRAGSPPRRSPRPPGAERNLPGSSDPAGRSMSRPCCPSGPMPTAAPPP